MRQRIIPLYVSLPSDLSVFFLDDNGLVFGPWIQTPEQILFQILQQKAPNRTKLGSSGTPIFGL